MYVGDIIRLARETTGNANFTQDSSGNITEGISNDLALAFLNDALAFIQGRIIAVYTAAWVEENIQSCVADQEAYSINDNVFLNNKFLSIELSSNGDLENYYPLAPASLFQRDTSSGRPCQYIRRNGELLLNPIPDSSNYSLRVNYQRTIDRLDIRRGQITSENGTSITLDNDAYLDSVALGRAQYVGIVSSLGVVANRNILVTSYDATTRVITIPSTTIGDVTGYFVVCGKYRTTHLQADVPERIEDYLRMALEHKLYKVDSSLDQINQREDVSTCISDIVDNFSEMTEDIQDIPIADPGMV